jgi:hypothetical protein
MGGFLPVTNYPQIFEKCEQIRRRMTTGMIMTKIGFLYVPNHRLKMRVVIALCKIIL